MLPPEFRPPSKLSWKMVLASLEQEERDKFLALFQDKELGALFTDWMFDARGDQIEPLGDWFIWLILCGRGWGKTWTGANWIIERHRTGVFRNSAIVAATSGDLRRSCIEGPSGVLALAPSYFKPEYKPSHQKLIWPNGSVTNLYTSEKPDRLRGPNHDGAWCDEIASWRYVKDAWDNLIFTLRFGDNPQILGTTTPRPTPFMKELLKRKGLILTRGSTYDNKQNLAKTYLQEIEEQYGGTRLGRQEIEGVLLDDVLGALWTYELLDRYRLQNEEELPPLVKTVVGLDPSTTDGANADEAGIIVAGASREKQAYVLADYSLRGSPAQWAKRAIEAYYEHDASYIIAEKNQGGEMVRETINNYDGAVPVKLVHAAKGKFARAEPVSMLYEQGRVHHLGVFSVLEDQLCTFVPGEYKSSPDRMDALVWAISELVVKTKKKAGVWGTNKSRSNKFAKVAA